jgi:hypothetical protein
LYFAVFFRFEINYVFRYKTCSRSARENFRCAFMYSPLAPSANSYFTSFYLKVGFEIFQITLLWKKIFLYFFRLRRNPLPLIKLSACNLVYIFLLVIGQGRRPLLPIGLTKVSNYTVPCLIMDQSYANHSASVIGLVFSTYY